MKRENLNEDLIEYMGLSENKVSIILSLHNKREQIEGNMSLAVEDEDWNYLQELTEAWTDNQYELQFHWGFNEDAKFHKFWYISACACPVMDNNDSYPSGIYVFSGNCKVHGRLIK